MKATPVKIDRLSMQTPAVYRIVVQGKLDAGWSDRFEGMKITGSDQAGGEDRTVLEGNLLDQAALSGVLNALYDFRLPVVSVECLTDPTQRDANGE